MGVHSHVRDLGDAMQSILTTKAEKEAYDLLREDKLLGARSAAEEALKKTPDSIVGHYVMGIVLRDAEGDLGRAMFHLGRSRELFEQRFDLRSQDIPWMFHRDLLFDTQRLAGNMEEYAYQLEILDYHAGLNYQPPLVAERAWPLMKLGRFDEARAVVTKVLAGSDADQRRLGQNALCAIEGEARTREPWFAACFKAYEDAKRGDGKTPADTISITVPAYNAALAAYGVVKHDEVERLAREGSSAKTYGVANPWRLLTGYYEGAGRFNEAVAAAREMNAWRAHEPVGLRDQDHAETDVTLASLLLVLGDADRGLPLVERAMDRPDRHGVTSSTPQQTEGAHALLRRSLARAAAEMQLEQSSYAKTSAKPRMQLRAMELEAEAWKDEQGVASILTDGRVLDATFRVHLGGGLEDVPTWLMGDLIPIVGPGIASVVLERARSEDASFAPVLPYYDALDAETALGQGDDERALALAERAFGALPKAEALLGARVAAVGSEAARRSGNKAKQLSWLERALSSDPGVVRRMRLTVPAEVVALGSEAVVVRAAEHLRSSPRLRHEGGAFRVTVEQKGDSVRTCLLGPHGSEIACGKTAVVAKETAEDFAVRVAEAFHREVFTPAVKLTSNDLHSLDGSTTVASQAARDGMRDALKGLTEE